MGSTRRDDTPLVAPSTGSYFESLFPFRAPLIRQPFETLGVMEASIETTSPEYTVLNLERGLKIATRVLVAGSSAARRRGLLGSGVLETGSGMWIAPCEAIHTFGMKIAIDAIFLDSEFQIKKLVARLPPRRISICIRASSVLELQEGIIVQTGTKVGDRLKFEPAARL